MGLRDSHPGGSLIPQTRREPICHPVHLIVFMFFYFSKDNNVPDPTFLLASVLRGLISCSASPHGLTELGNDHWEPWMDHRIFLGTINLEYGILVLMQYRA